METNSASKRVKKYFKFLQPVVASSLNKSLDYFRVLNNFYVLAFLVKMTTLPSPPFHFYKSASFHLGSYQYQVDFLGFDKLLNLRLTFI